MSRLPVPIHGRFNFAVAWFILAANVTAIISTMGNYASGEPLTWWTVVNALLAYHYGHKLYDHYRFEKMLHELHERFPHVR